MIFQLLRILQHLKFSLYCGMLDILIDCTCYSAHSMVYLLVGVTNGQTTEMYQ